MGLLHVEGQVPVERCAGKIVYYDGGDLADYSDGMGLELIMDGGIRLMD